MWLLNKSGQASSGRHARLINPLVEGNLPQHILQHLLETVLFFQIIYLVILYVYFYVQKPTNIGVYSEHSMG